MCGRFNDHLPKMHGWTDVLEEWPEYEASYNRAPTENIVAFSGKSGTLMRWGMIPKWSKTFESRFATFNARIESVDEKPSFRDAWRKRQRCLIPMAGYYEWIGAKGSKQPFYVRSSDDSILVAAGLYEHWGDDGLTSCTMLTQPATAELRPIHPRQPVMLDQSQARRWMNDEIDLSETERPTVVFHPVSTAVGNVRNDDQSLIRPTDLGL